MNYLFNNNDKKTYINIICLFFFIFSILHISLCIECPRDKPIEKNQVCMNIYCTPKEFENKMCTIANPFIKEQWLNNIHIFNNSGISSVSAVPISNGGLFLLSQEFSTGDKYIYSFSNDGNGLFFNKINNTYYSFVTIDFPENKYTEIFHKVNIDDKEYLLSTQTVNEMYLIDYNNINFTYYILNSTAHYSESIFKLNGYNDNEDDNIYFTSYIYCVPEYNLNECYLGLRIFKISLEKIEILAEISDFPDKIQIFYKSKLTCFQNEDLYIQCVYNSVQKINKTEKYEHVISLFNHKTLKLEHTEILEEDYKNIEGIFDCTILLKGNIFVTGYPYNDERNVLKILLKKFVVQNNEFILENYINGISYININKDEKYSLLRGLGSKRNSMCKINDYKFAILLNEFSNIGTVSGFNKNLIIIIFNIFNERYVSVRHYKIDFNLYGLIIIEDLRGYNLNNFFGVLLETGVDTNSFIPRATFLTFGYVNSTLNDIPIDKNLKENNTNSVIILKDYISEIENNLFLYKFIGVKILNLPDKEISGYFINNRTKETIKVGDIVNINTVLRFILVTELLIGNEFSIDFAGVVQEPDYDLMNLNAEELEIYPINDTELERDFYAPNTLIGRVIHYKFELKCYDSCSSCYIFSNNPLAQKCTKCKQNYYFQTETQNCFSTLDGYYLDSTTKEFLPCHSSCATCDSPPIDSKHMNCLTCKEGLYKYESNNCLNCSKYIDYELTTCIDEIPEGYFLVDEDLGILGKCHELCKTCYDYGEMYNMNCIECKYSNSKFIPEYEGQCPSENDEIIEGECPRDKPILRKNENQKSICSSDYCSSKEFEDKICEISNSIIKTQWLNNIQQIADDDDIYISLDYGFNNELFLFVQKRDDIINNIIYAIDENGKEFFYNNTSEEYFAFKTIDISNMYYFEKIKYVKNFENDKTFFVSSQIKNKIFAIDYFNEKIKEYYLSYEEYSSSNIFTLKKYPEEYFMSYIYCENESTNECYTYLKRFKFESDTNEIKITKEYAKQKKLNKYNNYQCFEGYNDYIQCIFTSIENENNVNYHALGLFNAESLSLMCVFGLEDEFDTEPFFDSMINLNDEVYVIAYSKDKNNIKVLLKTFKMDYNINLPSLIDYNPNIPLIDIYLDNDYIIEDSYTFFYRSNSLCKINNSKFAILINNFNDIKSETNEKPSLFIYIFTLFNKKQNISLRKYTINFKLYNFYNSGQIIGYNLGQFFGIFIELSSTEDKTVINPSFMTFGYVNTTNYPLLYDNDFIIDNGPYSKNILFKNYINEIENNLFGYEFLGVFILSLPDDNVGKFIKYNENDEEENIYINQTLNLYDEIKFKLNENYISGNYSIVFAGVVKEPEFEEMNKYSEEYTIYPIDSNTMEKDFYEPKILIGKRFEYKFNLKEKQSCYSSCLTCYSYSANELNHLCKICQPGYYFVEDTFNCYKELDKYYYFDEEKEIFSPCYTDCLTCDKKEINSTYMNCLSCEGSYKFYEKTKNCLDCPKYVNYLQTECIDTIPDGYYLADKNLGTIEKCHELCKTCSEGPFSYDNIYFMNCESCLYTNSKFIPEIEGNCPSSEENDDNQDEQCPKEKPIFKNNKCQLVYCTDDEFDKKECEILNKYIKTQWLNNYHIFDKNPTVHALYDQNEEGDLFFLSHKEENINIHRFLFAFNSKGMGLLYNNLDNKYISFKETSYEHPDYLEKIKHIKISSEDYLLSFLKDKIIYLYNYNKEKYYQIELFPYIPYSFDSLQKIRNKEDIYFMSYIYCTTKYIYDDCYISLNYYKIDNINNFIIESSYDKNNEENKIKVHYKSKLTCIENTNYFIQCIYSELKNDTNTYILSLFSHDDLSLKSSFILENNFKFEPKFDTMIELRDNFFIIAYSVDDNIIHVLFKKITLDINKNYILEDFFKDIEYININEDSIYDINGGNAFRNNLVKINDNEFIMLVNDFKNNDGYANVNSRLIIIVFKLYNFDRNIILRHYIIDFTLYNIFIEGDLRGYKLGEFFGILIEATSPTEKYNSRAEFLTFGYVNATEDISYEEGTNNLIDNKLNIKINEYITGIENNLFGYEFVGVKIISLPNENKAGYFININNNDKKINLDNIIDINSELKFIPNSYPVSGNYTISFAGVVREPEYNISNNFAYKVELYPNTSSPEKYLTEQKILIGKEFKYNFKLGEKKCYKNCETCIRPSEDINEQDCITCKQGFYFKDGTNNCYDEIAYQYYFNEETKKFYPCYRDCYTCKTKEINSTYMNCLSCHNLYKLYEKTKNCLKCPKYVNYLQTGCIDTIPDGYYLSDQIFGIIDKCHNLCKTCNSGPTTLNGVVHMNCETCLYTSSSKKLIEGNCPESSERNDNKYDNDNKKAKKSNNSVFIWITIILIILILVVIGIMIYIKCRQNKNIKKNNTDYYNIGGRNIPFEDEYNSGIN